MRHVSVDVIVRILTGYSFAHVDGLGLIGIGSMRHASLLRSYEPGHDVRFYDLFVHGPLM